VKSGTLRRFRTLEDWSRGGSWLHRRDPRFKLLSALVLLAAIAVAPTRSFTGLLLASAVGLAILFMAAVEAGLPPLSILARGWVVLPFTGVFALLAWLEGNPHRAATLLAKSWLSAVTVVVLMATTPLDRLLAGMQSLGVPPLLASVVQFVWRYLHVALDQLRRMQVARLARGGERRFVFAAATVAVLFASSAARAEPITGAAEDAACRLVFAGRSPRLGAAFDGFWRMAVSHHQPIVEVRGLRFRYEDGTEALRGVDFMVHRGERVALLGANGSGKTTFLLHLNGILRGAGFIEVCGTELADSSLKSIRRKIGFLFQDPDDQLFLPTVLEDVAFGPLEHGCPAEEAIRRARAALERVGLQAEAARAPHRLSAGQRQRVALAGILAAEPEILVLDEPTTHLDPPSRAAFLALLEGLPQSLLLVSHDVAFAARLAKRAVFFEQGQIVADGPIDEIVRRFGWA